MNPFDIDVMEFVHSIEPSCPQIEVIGTPVPFYQGKTASGIWVNKRAVHAKDRFTYEGIRKPSFFKHYALLPSGDYNYNDYTYRAFIHLETTKVEWIYMLVRIIYHYRFKKKPHFQPIYEDYIHQPFHMAVAWALHKGAWPPEKWEGLYERWIESHRSSESVLVFVDKQYETYKPGLNP